LISLTVGSAGSETVEFRRDGVAGVAAIEVIVHEPRFLHERVDRRRADERPAAPLQVARQRPRLRGLRERSRSASRPDKNPSRLSFSNSFASSATGKAPLVIVVRPVLGR